MCQGRRHLCLGADADSCGPSVQKIIEIPQLQSFDKVVDACCACLAVPRCSRGGDSRAPTVAPFCMDTVVAMPVVVQRQLPWFRRQKTAQVPQFQYFYVVDVPVVQVHLGSSSPWTRSLTCPLLSTAWVMQTVKVTQIQLIACFLWTFQLCNTDGYDASNIFGYGGDEWVFFANFPHFRSSDQFSEPSSTHTCECWRAPAQFHAQSLLT